jgi:hypothetical protein
VETYFTLQPWISSNNSNPLSLLRLYFFSLWATMEQPRRTAAAGAYLAACSSSAAIVSRYF